MKVFKKFFFFPGIVFISVHIVFSQQISSDIISREQKTTGTPPTNYAYGHEIIDSTDIITQETDNQDQSHGTHVAGIAAGSGYGGNEDKYRGIAFESDLVLIGITPAQSQWKNSGMTDIVDGLN